MSTGCVILTRPLSPEAEFLCSIYEQDPTRRIFETYDSLGAYDYYKKILPQYLDGSKEPKGSNNDISVKNMVVTNSDLTDVLAGITVYDGNLYGIEGPYLSVIAELIDGDVVIESREAFTNRVPDHFGMLNEKNITVEGSASDCLGEEQKGNIHVTGDVLNKVGARMVGGEMVIEGNASNSPGYRMQGGKLTIEGDVGDNPGTEMSGGVLDLKGNYRGTVGRDMKLDAKIYLTHIGKLNPIDPTAMGEIYVDGELFWEGGRKVA